MGQTSSNLSLLSRKSAGGSSINSADYIGNKFVRTSALNQPLIFNPLSSSHQTFRNYLSSPNPKVKRKRSGSNSSGKSVGTRGDAEFGTGSENMPVVLYLSPQDIINIKDSWASVERQLIGLGVRVFISLLESQPNIKRTFRQYRSKRHSELRINEDLQKLILYLICGMKRVVKYLNDNKSLTKYLRRMAKKHYPTEIDLGRINPKEVSSVFCTALKEITTSPEEETTWNSDVEDSWANLLTSLINAIRCLTKPPDKLIFHESSDDVSEGTDSQSSSHKSATFDRHLVLVGCQTFQEFFDRHPEVLSHFDKFSAIEIDEVKVSDALRMHASRVLAIVEDIVENTGNPDKIRSLMQDLGRHHFKQGITQEHLDMLGPLICHTIRPLVFRTGLWTIEVEKSWSHLFGMVATLMKRGYPGVERCMTGFFPTLTHTLLLKDTWGLIIEQMQELGFETFIKLFRLSANLRYYYAKHNRPETPDGLQSNINHHFESLVSVIDAVVRSLPDISSHVDLLRRLGAMHCDVEIQPRLLELMGPVFCNTVRPLLLVQGKWSYKVESAWLLLFRHIAGFMSCGYEHPVVEKEEGPLSQDSTCSPIKDRSPSPSESLVLEET